MMWVLVVSTYWCDNSDDEAFVKPLNYVLVYKIASLIQGMDNGVVS